MMLAAGLLFSGSAYAQNQSDGTTGATKQTEKVDKEAKGNKEVKGRGMRGSNQAFQGIELSPEQLAQLQELQKGLGPVILNKEQMKDSVSKEERKRQQAAMKQQRQDSKKNYLNGVKQILTPEQ